MPAATDGQVMIGATGSIMRPAKITAGTGIAVTVGPNRVRISATGSASAASYNAENKDASSVSQGMAVATHSSGTGVVLACAVDNTLPAVGLSQADTAPTFSTPVQVNGLMTLADWTAVTGTVTLSALAIYFLSPSTPGKLTTVRPVASGQVIQVVGKAVSSDTLELLFDEPYLLS